MRGGRWKVGVRGRGWSEVEGGSEGERGGKSRHGTSTHHQFFVAVETDDGGQFLSGADGCRCTHTVR